MPVPKCGATCRTTTILIFMALVGGVLLFHGTRVALAVCQLYSAAHGAGAAAVRPKILDIPMLRSELRRADEALEILESERAGFKPAAATLLDFLSTFPVIGSGATTIQDLLEVSDEGLTLGRKLADRMQLRLASPEYQVDSATHMSPLVLAATAGRDMEALAPDIRELAAAATGIAASGKLPASIRTMLEQVVEGSNLTAAAASLGPHLSWLLGMDSPRTFLVLAQNNDELRATGGFISAVGTITLDQGQLTVNDLVDSYTIFREDVDHPPAPRALQQYMKAYILLLRDANWSPDAPTSAQTAADLYKLDTGVQVDGVLLLDMGALQHLITALGAVTLPESGVTLTATDVEQQLIKLWNPPEPTGETTPLRATESISAATAAKVVLPAGWWEQRKDFVPQVAHAVLQQAEAGTGSLLSLAPAVLDALDDRSLQVWVQDEATARTLNKLDWDGALDPLPGADFLAVVDSNVGFNKVDAVMARRLDYAVDWSATGAPVATLTLTYTHPLPVADPGCEWTPRYGRSYADMTKRCYFDYVRVYAPARSRLLTNTGLQPGSTTSEVGEKGLQVFAGYFVQPPNSVHVVTLTYELPTAFQPHNYALVLQRQAGVKLLPVTLHIGSAYTTVELQAGHLQWQSERDN